MRAWLSNLHEALRRRISAIHMRTWLHELHKAAYRRFPKFVSDPDYQRRLAVYRSRDHEENERSRPPEDESIKLRCFWATEYYLPSHFDGLIASFEKLGWDDLLLVQRKSIPYLLKAQNLMVQAKTGSGKTGAFVIPLLQVIETDYQYPQAMVLVPTRELACAVSELSGQGEDNHAALEDNRGASRFSRGQPRLATR